MYSYFYFDFVCEEYFIVTKDTWIHTSESIHYSYKLFWVSVSGRFPKKIPTKFLHLHQRVC